jgi:hypothetical protein
MKNHIKWFGIIAFVAIIGFSMVGCDLNNNDYEGLNGDWDAGDRQVTFNDDKGFFKDFTGGIWLQAKNAGQINIGDQCFRNIAKSDDNKWTCEIRVYNTNNMSETLYWTDCTITLMANGKIRIVTSGLGSYECIKM